MAGQGGQSAKEGKPSSWQTEEEEEGVQGSDRVCLTRLAAGDE